MAIGLVGRKVRHDPHLHRGRRVRAGDGDRSRAEPRHADQGAGRRRLSRRAGDHRYAPPLAGHQGARGSFRQGLGRGRPRHVGVPSRRRRRRGSAAGRRDQGRHLRGGPEGGRDAAPPSARASPARSSATISAPRTPPTAIRCRTARRARSVRTRPRVACSRARRWRGTWATCAARRRTSRWYASTQSATCCWSRARCPAPRAATSSCARRSRRRAEEADMELTLTTASGNASKKTVEVSEATFGREFNEPLVHQVVTAYMAGARAGTKAQKNRGRAPRRRRQALAAEGHRPRARRQHSQPHLDRRRRDLRRQPARLFAEGQPQDVPRCHALDPLRAQPPGAPGGGRQVGDGHAEDQRNLRGSSRRLA